jgi:hypothetical protein
MQHRENQLLIIQYNERFVMEKIELEFDSKLTSTEQILEKVSQVVKYAKDQGLNLRELELEAEGDEQEKEDD